MAVVIPGSSVEAGSSAMGLCIALDLINSDTVHF